MHAAAVRWPRSELAWTGRLAAAPSCLSCANKVMYGPVQVHKLESLRGRHHTCLSHLWIAISGAAAFAVAPSTICEWLLHPSHKRQAGLRRTLTLYNYWCDPARVAKISGADLVTLCSSLITVLFEMDAFFLYSEVAALDAALELCSAGCSVAARGCSCHTAWSLERPIESLARLGSTGGLQDGEFGG